MQKWEYKVTDWVGKGWDGNINFRDAYKLLSEMGEEGWELVAVKDGVAIFKRSKQNTYHWVESFSIKDVAQRAVDDNESRGSEQGTSNDMGL